MFHVLGPSPPGHEKFVRGGQAMADAIPVDEGDEDGPRVEEAALLLNLLEKVGLVGAKLAVSSGSEVELARQLAAHAGIQQRRWHITFVETQVRAAQQMADLEERLDGFRDPPESQMLADAVLQYEKVKAEEARALVQEEAEPTRLPIPKRGTLGKSVRLKTGRIITDDMAEDKVMKILLEELQLAKAPVLEQLARVKQQDRALQALAGKYRPSTLRRYLAGWQHYRKWCDKADRVTSSATTFIDYMYVREEEGMGASIPLAVSRSISWFQDMCQVSHDAKLVNDMAVDLVIKELVRKLESRAPPIKRAPRWMALLIGPMEELIMDRREPKGRRRAAWMKLVKLWAALRFSDAANMRTKDIKVYDGKLTALLRKTKTTGAGKRVRELPVYIDSCAFVYQKDWLVTGYELMKAKWVTEDQYVFSEGIFDEGMAGVGSMRYYEASAASADVLRSLKDHEGDDLLPESIERFWSEHSERATLPSALAALGIGKTDRDLIGRWMPEGSDQYVRTYNAAVARLQRRFSNVVRRGEAYESFDEGAVLEEVKDWLTSHWNVEPKVANDSVEALKKRLKLVSGIMTKDGETSGDETEVITTEEEDDRVKLRKNIERDEKMALGRMAERPKKERKMQHLAEERDGGYVIVYQRAGRGTLHQLGPSACWMAKKRSFAKSETFKDCPEPESYSTWCRLCWRESGKKDPGSTSDSCDDLDLSDVTDG